MSGCAPCRAKSLASVLSNMIGNAAKSTALPQQRVNGSPVITGTSPLPQTAIVPSNGNTFGNPTARITNTTR